MNARAARAITSARLTFKIHRFEVLAATIGLLLLAGAAFWIKAQLDGAGATRECLEAWLATGGEPEAACVAPVQRWAEITNDLGGKLSGGMLFMPLVAGLLLGVPLVGREIEQRTAATAWAFAGSRRRWLAGRLAPVLLLAIALGVALSIASSVLEVARTADGIWGTSFGAAMFFGPPVIAHVVFGLAVGLVAGALIGRTLPAGILGGVAILVSLFVVMTIQSSWQERADLAGFGWSGDERDADLLDPNADYRFVTPDAGYLTRDEALATVPAGTADVQGWLRDHYQPEFHGVSEALTREWQTVETTGVLLASGVLLLLAFPIVERRRPG